MDRQEAINRWQWCQDILRKRVGEDAYFSSVGLLEFLSFEASPSGGFDLKLQVPSRQVVNVLAERYREEITETIGMAFGDRVRIQMAEKAQPAAPKEAMRDSSLESPINKRFDFAHFQSGISNRVAFQLAQAVAHKPGQAPQNLFFLYGASGVGKTHLCHAIAQEVEAIYPESRVVYIHSGQFLSEFTKRVSEKTGRADFIRYFQQVDVLIIDDIHNLINKTATQAVFFEIFNHLVDLGKQIVLTCDMPAVALKGMDERVQTRIQSSLMIEIARPDMDLRKAILLQRLEETGLKMTDQMISYITQHAVRNVREINGIINTLWGEYVATREPITMAQVARVVGSSVQVEQGQPALSDIQKAVYKVFGLDAKKLFEQTRRSEIVLPRQVFMYLVGECTDFSLQAIARYLKLRSHSTIKHGQETIARSLATDEVLRQRVLEIRSLIES